MSTATTTTLSYTVSTSAPATSDQYVAEAADRFDYDLSHEYYLVDIRPPSWATGLIDYEIIPGENGKLGAFIINDIPGFKNSLRNSGTLFNFLVRMRTLRCCICAKFSSISTPQEDLSEGTLYIWGGSSEYDREPSDLHRPGLLKAILDAYNRSFLYEMRGSSINEETSNYNDTVPAIGSVYRYRENGIWHTEQWLYRDEDIERWKIGRLEEVDS